MEIVQLVNLNVSGKLHPYSSLKTQSRPLASLECDMDRGSVVEFRLRILWSLVRSPVGEITLYIADET